MSWYEIIKKVRVLTEGASRTSAGKKIDASRNRLFRVAIMSCACLLMNTAATVSISVVLEDWSVSSDKWLTCSVAETFYTRNWANYGMHVGDRYSRFSSWRRDTCWLLFWLLLLHFLGPALQGMNRVMTSPMKQQTVEEDCWKKCARRIGPLVLITTAHGLIHLLFENQYCSTECPCSFCLVPRHVIGTQKSYFVNMALIFLYAAKLENIPPFLSQVRVFIMFRSLQQPP